MFSGSTGAFHHSSSSESLASALRREKDERGERMQLHRESRICGRLVAQIDPVALGLDVNTSSLTSFSNLIF